MSGNGRWLRRLAASLVLAGNFVVAAISPGNLGVDQLADNPLIERC